METVSNQSQPLTSTNLPLSSASLSPSSPSSKDNLVFISPLGFTNSSSTNLSYTCRSCNRHLSSKKLLLHSTVSAHTKPKGSTSTPSSASSTSSIPASSIKSTSSSSFNQFRTNPAACFAGIRPIKSKSTSYIQPASFKSRAAASTAKPMLAKLMK